MSARPAATAVPLGHAAALRTALAPLSPPLRPAPAPFSYAPEDSYASALLAHVRGSFSSLAPDSLSQALWALARLKRAHLAGPGWLFEWLAAAGPAVPALSPPALAGTAWALAELRGGAAAAGPQPPVAGAAADCDAAAPDESFLTRLTLRASEVLESCSAAELTTLIGALADLRWRPSDAWLQVRVCLWGWG